MDIQVFLDRVDKDNVEGIVVCFFGGGVKLWLDDIREVPEGWVWFKTAEEAIEALKSGLYTEISFDHDLGDEFGLDTLGTGYSVAVWIEEMAWLGQINRLRWHIHSANPVGRRNIEFAMRNADIFWNEKEGIRDEGDN